MSFIDPETNELHCKIVYCGPPLSGKTTSISYIHQHIPAENRGEITSIASVAGRALFFDCTYQKYSTVLSHRVRFHLYTEPGAAYYPTTRKLLLKGVDGIIFVADSQEEMRRTNLSYLEEVLEILTEYNRSPLDIPFIFQYNKRNIKKKATIDELERALNPNGFPYTYTIATKGYNVMQTFEYCCQKILKKIDPYFDEENSLSEEVIQELENALFD